eukprot:scaffold5266_cov116-Isochrysis_galbana.AAC.4
MPYLQVCSPFKVTVGASHRSSSSRASRASSTRSSCSPVFVRNEWGARSPGQPTPLKAIRFSPGAQRCFLTKIKEIAAAPPLSARLLWLVPKLPNNGARTSSAPSQSAPPAW